MTHRGESAILRRVESLVRQLLDEMLAERGIGGAWDAAGEGSAPLDRTVTEPDGSSSSGSKARQLDALVRDLEREAPVTTRALPYPPDPVEVAADLLAELLACYRLAGWDPVDLEVTPVTGPPPLVVLRSGGYLDSEPLAFDAGEARFAVGVLAELLACYRLAGWDPVDLEVTPVTGPPPLVSARIAELILDCLPEPVRS